MSFYRDKENTILVSYLSSRITTIFFNYHGASHFFVIFVKSSDLFQNNFDNVFRCSDFFLILLPTSPPPPPPHILQGLLPILSIPIFNFIEINPSFIISLGISNIEFLVEESKINLGRSEKKKRKIN